MLDFWVVKTVYYWVAADKFSPTEIWVGLDGNKLYLHRNPNSSYVPESDKTGIQDYMNQVGRC